MNGLLIDDDAVYAQVLKHSLERRGCRLQRAHNAESALALAGTEIVLGMIFLIREINFPNFRNAPLIKIAHKFN